MTNNQDAELSLLQRLGGFIIGGTIIALIGLALLIAFEVFFDPSPFLTGFCFVVIVLTINLWGRRYGLTTIFGR